MRAPTIVLSLLFLGAILGGLQTVPPAAASCHCVSVSCYNDDYDDDEDGSLSDSELERWKVNDPCDSVATIRVKALSLIGGVYMEGWLGAAGATVDAEGHASLPAGVQAIAGLSFHQDGATSTGSVRFRASPGVNYTGEVDHTFDTSRDGVAHVTFVLAEEGPSSVSIPFTVTRAGVPDYEDSIEITRADAAIEDPTGDMTITEIALLSGIVGAILGAILAAVVVLVSRRS